MSPRPIHDIYISPTAHSYSHSDSSVDPLLVRKYHHSLPSFTATPLHDLPQLASTLGLGRLLLKSESARLGLPAFKILGASWGVYRALCEELLGRGVETGGVSLSVEEVRELVRGRDERVVLFAATDGNHGRAVARMAKLLLCDSDANADADTTGRDSAEPRAVIYVPRGMYASTKALIAGEGAEVVTVDGDYDDAVAACWEACQRRTGGVMVQDNAFDGYEVIPTWIVEGYGTLLGEVDEQFEELVKGSGTGQDQKPVITHVVTPIGVGSLGHAVVKWAKDARRTDNKVRVITAEPETAACLNASLRKGANTSIETVDTIMSGMCCGTVSPISWPTLKDGVDCSMTVGDWEAHEAVLELEGCGIEAGPCGAGCLAGLKKIMGIQEVRNRLGLDKDSVVVVLCTEGRREYPVPERPSV